MNINATPFHNQAGEVSVTITGVDPSYADFIQNESGFSYESDDKHYKLKINTAETLSFDLNYGAESTLFLPTSNLPTAESPFTAWLSDGQGGRAVYGSEDYAIFEGRVNSVFNAVNGLQ